MQNRLKNIIKDYTRCMFNEQWYSELSGLLLDEINRMDEDFQEGYVYVIKSKINGLYKIGISTSPRQRFQNIKTSVGEIIVYSILMTNKYKSIEKEMHDRFKDCRVYGEWFDLLKFSDEHELRLYLISKGFLIINEKYNSKKDYESDSLSVSKPLGAPNEIMAEFDKIELGRDKKYDKTHIFKIVDKNKKYSQRKITQWFEDYCISKGFFVNHGRTNSSRYIELS